MVPARSCQDLLVSITGTLPVGVFSGRKGKEVTQVQNIQRKRKNADSYQRNEQTETKY